MRNRVDADATAAHAVSTLATLNVRMHTLSWQVVRAAVP